MPNNNRKIINIEEENLHILRTNLGISIKFSGKVWLRIILNLTKSHGFTFSIENTFLEKHKSEGSNWPLPPLQPLRVKNIGKAKTQELMWAFPCQFVKVNCQWWKELSFTWLKEWVWDDVFKKCWNELEKKKRRIVWLNGWVFVYELSGCGF